LYKYCKSVADTLSDEVVDVLASVADTLSDGVADVLASALSALFGSAALENKYYS
jgi:hypothetical protein